MDRCCLIWVYAAAYKNVCLFLSAALIYTLMKGKVRFKPSDRKKKNSTGAEKNLFSLKSQSTRAHTLSNYCGHGNYQRLLLPVSTARLLDGAVSLSYFRPTHTHTHTESELILLFVAWKLNCSTQKPVLK